MQEWINITQYNWVLWVAGLFALLDLFKWFYTDVEWFFKKTGWETKGMREKREANERLTKVENSIDKIEKNSDRNVEMFLEHEKQVVDKFMDIKAEIVAELGKLHQKIDEQAEVIEENNEASIKTDLAMLRDRLNSGMRYFSQNKDADGNVHISWGDFETLDALFQEYFEKGGNGAFKRMYYDEFLHFIIDR